MSEPMKSVMVKDVSLEGQVEVLYPLEYEEEPGTNTTLKFTVSGAYDITVRCYYSTGSEQDVALNIGDVFWVVESIGEGGVQSTLARNRLRCLEAAMNTYGAPHTQEWVDLVDRLLVKAEHLRDLVLY